MKAERPLKVVFFKTEAGNEPVGKPLVDNLGDGLWEVRSRLSNRIARTLFAVVDEEIVLLHGFIKKQQRTPQNELELAKKRKKQYLLNL
jgi:phage-related protein